MRLSGAMNPNWISFLTFFGAALYCHGGISNVTITFDPGQVSVGKNFKVKCELTFKGQIVIVLNVGIKQRSATNATAFDIIVIALFNVDDGKAKVKTSEKRVKASGGTSERYVTAMYSGATCSDEGQYRCYSNGNTASAEPFNAEITVFKLIEGCQSKDVSFTVSPNNFKVGSKVTFNCKLAIEGLVKMIKIKKTASPEDEEIAATASDGKVQLKKDDPRITAEGSTKEKSSTVTYSVVQSNDTGRYICIIFYSVDGDASYMHWNSVKFPMSDDGQPPEDEDEDKKDGTKETESNTGTSVGIVVGGVVIILLVSAIIYKVLFKGKAAPKENPEKGAGATQSQPIRTPSQPDATQSKLDATQSKPDATQSKLDATQSESDATLPKASDAEEDTTGLQQQAAPTED